MNPNLVVYPIKLTTTVNGKVCNTKISDYTYEVYSPTSGKLMACGVAATEHGARTKAGIQYSKLCKYYVNKKT